VRFISAEPLLSPLEGLELDGIDWLIAGGESGPIIGASTSRGFATSAIGARPRASRSSSSRGGRTPKAGGGELDGPTWDELPAAVSVALPEG
jgi:protein gp37